MVMPSRHRAAVRSGLKGSTSAPAQPTSAHHRELIAAAGGTVLVMVIAVLAVWADYSLSHRQPAVPTTAAAEPATGVVSPLMSSPQELRRWLTQAEPSIDALLGARDQIAAAAADDDIAATEAACQSAEDAVASVQPYLPSPDPVLTATLRGALDGYHVGLRYCLAGAHNRDGHDIEQAAIDLRQADTALQTAWGILERDLADVELHDPDLMTV